MPLSGQQDEDLVSLCDMTFMIKTSPTNPPTHVPCHAGFQAFNLNPATKGCQQKQYVPATLFLVSDHLQVSCRVGSGYRCHTRL